MTVEKIKKNILGEWTSIATEIRPSSTKNPDGSIKPFYLTRIFRYLSDDKFELDIINFADAFGKIPLANIGLKGHILWQGPHPLIPGAQKVDFIADEAYEVTPLIESFTDLLNQFAVNGYEKWQTNKPQSILKKAFVLFGLAEGQIFSEFDLIFSLNNLLFWGARNVDGRGFDTEENRPTNLQIPLIKR